MTELYGLLGYPLSHSFSKGYFTEKFKRECRAAEYQNFELSAIEHFPALIQSVPDLRGMNVTIPYKQAVMPYLDELDGEAGEIGAVNVIRFDRSGSTLRLIGYNTDVTGFRESLRPLVGQLRIRLGAEHEKGLKALILGTGGASKAVFSGLRQLGIEPHWVSRKASTNALAYAELTCEHYETYNVLVNTTPLGMYPNVETCPPLDYSMIGEKHLLFDAVYNPEKTLFLEKGEANGALIKNGLEMLHLQAEEAWKIWNGLK